MMQSNRDASRCIWCHGNGGERVALRVLEPRFWARGTRKRSVSVHPGHEMEVRRYYDKVRRFSRVFLGSIALGLAAPFVFLIFLWFPGLAATLVYLGIVMWLFPFSTETTIELIGIKNSMRLARACSAAIVMGGFVCLAFL